MEFSARILIFLLLTSLFAASCSSSRRTAKKMKETTMNDDQKVLDALTQHPFTYRFLTAKAKVRVESPSMNISGNLQMRVKPGEAIWASVTKFGFEVFDFI
jgi:PBP1b-binding outer membrane lipoprotein LpoB